ncbi:MAG: acetamidase/formamidase family protein [Clostridia bacterium]|nr:acetamidase/formamidase family protein [Clostridia bacterium]
MAHILVNRDSFHLAFDKDISPVARAHSGDTATFLCRDCYNGELSRDGMDFAEMDMSTNNPVTGPLYIEEAEAGDVLKVEILAIRPDDKGCMCARLGSGIYNIEGCHCRIFPIDREKMTFDFDGITIPMIPMIGVIGTAPAGAPIPTTTPDEHGGNLDIKDMNEGVTLYLPVNVPGALLSMGDLHGVQGDGETVICALEMNGEVDVRVTVLKGRSDIPTPFLVNKTHYMTTAADPSLDVCSVKAAHKMHGFLMEHAGLSDAQAGMLLSLKGNLRISQVVNPHKGCIMEFPKGILPIDFEE